MSALTPQTILFLLLSDDTNDDEPIINHVLLIFDLHVYDLREKPLLNIMNSPNDINEIKKREYRLSSNSEKNRKIYQNK